MKPVFLFTAFILLGNFFGSGQNIGYVDSDKILESMPEYKQAQEQLKFKSEQFQKEVKDRQDALKRRELEFANEKILLTPAQVQQREKDLEEERIALKDLTDKRFGPTGDMFRSRRALVKPLQDKIAGAIDKVANGSKKYGIIFDKSSDLIMLYTDPRFDLTERVLNELEKDRPNTDKNKNKPKNRNRRN